HVLCPPRFFLLFTSRRLPTSPLFPYTTLFGIILFLASKSEVRASKPIYGITAFLVNLFRAIPFIILIILLIPFTKVMMGTIMGPNGAIPALIIGSAPFYARLVEIGLKEIDKGVIEAAESM